uniref:Uncharacterized protein n=1 Tax=Aegilops tauschii subsp. strangulata TaxID=200361 RepID=A0A452XS56_AEGTS
MARTSPWRCQLQRPPSWCWFSPPPPFFSRRSASEVLAPVFVQCFSFRNCLPDDVCWLLLPPSQNKCLNFVLTLVQSCTKLVTFILRRREYYLSCMSAS